MTPTVALVPWWVWPAAHLAVCTAAALVLPRRRSPQAASAWLLLIFLAPWLGVPLFLLVGRVGPSRRTRKAMAMLPGRAARAAERMLAHVEAHDPFDGQGVHPTAALASRLGHFRPLRGNAVEVVADYDAAVDGLVADIDAARDHVHLLYYIFAGDRTGRRVGEALLRARERGVACRVLADAVGSRADGRAWVRELSRRGVDAVLVAPVRFRRMFFRRPDHRNHRKIAVVDGRVAWTGSQNVVDADLGGGLRCEDLVVRLGGPVVVALQYVFLADWWLARGEMLDAARHLPPPVPAGDVVAQALPSGPTFAADSFQWVLVDLLHRARERAVVVSPYFVPDAPILQALGAAAARGVDVRVVVPKLSDQVGIGLAVESYFEDLAEHGVHVHRYLPAFLHAKHMTVDDEVAVVGSSNVDVRSFALNDEITLVVYDRAVARRLRAEEDRYLAASEELDLDAWEQRGPGRRVLQSVARLFTPIL